MSFITDLQAGEKRTIAFYGTSLTEGGAWTTQLRDHLTRRFDPSLLNFHNGGLSGRASNTGLWRIHERLLDHHPDVVFIEFATNDAFTAFVEGDIDRGISLEKSRLNLNAMIGMILAQNPAAQIILQTMNPAWDAPNGNCSGSKRPRLPDYFQGYRDVAAERGLMLIDHHANWMHLMRTDRPRFDSYIPDGVHPVPEGCAAVITPAIIRALS